MMVAKHPVPAAAPPDLYGIRERDRTMRALNLLADGFLGVAPLIYRRRPPTTELSAQLALTLVSRTVEAADQDVVSLVFEAPDGAALPIWTPGAHLDVLLPSGRLRQYSLCGDPFERGNYRIAVRRVPDGGGGSIEMHALPVGETITVRGPRNAFAFTGATSFGAGPSTTSSLRFIAGGIGITPILPMVRLADRMGLDWSLAYTGRSLESLPFLDELRAFGSRVTILTDDIGGLPSAAELLGAEQLGTGPLDAGPLGAGPLGAGPLGAGPLGAGPLGAGPLGAGPLGAGQTAAEPPTAGVSGAVYYCCGPTAMSAALLAAVPPTTEFHFERFSAPPVVDGADFTVELARSGEVLTVPADRTALEVIRERLPNVPYSCQQGFCHTCEVKVLRGEVDHRDSVLTPAQREDGGMLICVSRGGSGHLTLDL